MSSTWSKARIDMLRQLAAELQSALQIAAAMSEKFDVEITRNAVIGQATRLGIKLDGARFRGGRPRSSSERAASDAPGAGIKPSPSEAITSAGRSKSRRSAENLQAMQEPRKPAPPVAAIPIAEPSPPPASARRPAGNAVDDPFDMANAEAFELSNAARAILTLRPGQCKWPSGDTRGGGFHFCCEPVAGVGPYCTEHRAEAYTTLAEQKRAAKEWREKHRKPVRAA